MEEMLQEWKKELIEAGLLEADEDISQMELMQRWQEYQSKKMKEHLSGFAREFGVKEDKGAKIPETARASDDLADLRAMVKKNPELTDQFSDLMKSESQRREKKGNIREGIKLALNALITNAKGASYCMIVVDSAWINFRHKKSKDNLHLQVAGNQYISPLELSDEDINKLEAMDITPEEASNDIWATDFDDTPRDLDKIVDTALQIFREIYQIKDGRNAYIELDLGKGDEESIRNNISQYFERHDGKQFKWEWANSV